MFVQINTYIIKRPLSVLPDFLMKCITELFPTKWPAPNTKKKDCPPLFNNNSKYE